jgi:hypothetical protein
LLTTPGERGTYAIRPKVVSVVKGLGDTGAYVMPTQ